VPATFELSSVVHLVRPAGFSAHHLDDLREGIARATASTLFLHAVTPMMRHPAAEALPPDDFSSWVNGVVQDRETAERLAFVVNDRGSGPGPLREGLTEVIGAIAPDKRVQRDAPEGGDFVFLDLESVAVSTGVFVHDAESLVSALAVAEPGVWFYHLIEQPWLAPERPSLVDWVRAAGDARLVQWLEEAGASGRPLEELRRRTTRRWKQSRLGRRVAEAAHRSEEERREAGREAVLGLVRRITGQDGPP
jgi:uncharacterized protein DUF5752